VTLFDEFRQVRLEGKLARISQNHVEGIIDHGAPISEIVIVGDNAIEFEADVLRGERDDRRSPAKGR
jgi:hypothetical protein